MQDANLKLEHLSRAACLSAGKTVLELQGRVDELESKLHKLQAEGVPNNPE